MLHLWHIDILLTYPLWRRYLQDWADGFRICNTSNVNEDIVERSWKENLIIIFNFMAHDLFEMVNPCEEMDIKRRGSILSFNCEFSETLKNTLIIRELLIFRML